MRKTPFELFLFTTDKNTILDAIKGGVSGFIVDWEYRDKEYRQKGYDTQISQYDVKDLQKVRSATDALVICRVNGYAHPKLCKKEIDNAINNGADEIFLPMVRTVEEVIEVLKYVNEKCGVGILIETKEAVKLASELGQLPLTRVYIGLNDLAIDRKIANIFESLRDGTVDLVRKNMKVPFGFAGLTLPEFGDPIPCRLIMSEMARLDCSFSFLRRSFFRDTSDKDISKEIPRIYEAIQDSFALSFSQKTANRHEINRIIKKCSPFFLKEEQN